MSRGIEITRDRPWTMPVAGTIAAGSPIEAIESIESVSMEDMFKYKDCYLLKVKGSSMVEDCIQDGDYVIINPQKTAANGQIVVAIIDEEATLKRFYKEKNRVRLQPANSAMKPIYVQLSDLEIRGIVVGILRKY